MIQNTDARKFLKAILPRLGYFSVAGRVDEVIGLFLEIPNPRPADIARMREYQGKQFLPFRVSYLGMLDTLPRRYRQPFQDRYVAARKNHEIMVVMFCGSGVIMDSVHDSKMMMDSIKKPTGDKKQWLN